MNLAFVYVAKGLEVSFKVLNKVPADATVGWDGILFQIAGGVTIKTVKLSQPNIYFSNVVNETFSAE